MLLAVFKAASVQINYIKHMVKIRDNSVATPTVSLLATHSGLSSGDCCVPVELPFSSSLYLKPQW